MYINLNKKQAPNFLPCGYMFTKVSEPNLFAIELSLGPSRWLRAEGRTTKCALPRGNGPSMSIDMGESSFTYGNVHGFSSNDEIFMDFPEDAHFHNTQIGDGLTLIPSEAGHLRGEWRLDSSTLAHSHFFFLQPPKRLKR